MEKRKLGISGAEVSRLIYGTLTLGPLQKNMSIGSGASLLNYAYDMGITAFDTAQYYKTYEYLKPVAKKDAFIISKSYAFDRNGAKSALEEAFKGIGRDYIDVFLMHEQESEHTIKGHMAALEYYLEQKQKGYIGHVGLSTHRISGVLGAIKYDEIEIIHPLINVTGIGIEDGTREDMEQVLIGAHNMGKGIYGMKVMGGGNLIKSREEALDYALGCGFLDALAIGMASKSEIDYNIKYISGDKEGAQKTGADIRDKRLHIEQWCTGCGSCTKRCGQCALSIKDGKACVDYSKCVLCGYCGGACPEFCIKVL